MREDWIECDLQEVCFSSKGKKPPILASNISEKINVPYINIKAFEKGIIDEYTDGNKCNLCEDGDLLMVWDGARAGLSGKAKKGAVGSTLMKIEEVNGIEKQYLSYFLLSLYTKINTNPRGVGIPHVEPRILWYSKLLIVCSPIQRAIVTKIEALFSDLDNGIANFKKAQEQLKIYRQAVLKKAFEGGFSSVLENDEIPLGWIEGELGNIISISSGKGLTKENREDDGGVYFVYGGNGITGKHSEFIFENEKLIIGRVGVHCGNVHITKPKSWITDNAFVVSFDENVFDLYFLHYFLINLNLNKYASSTAQPVISQGKIYPIEIFYPNSKEEQTQIVQEIESRLSVCDKVEQSITESIEKAEALRQSILKKAFEGKLLSQGEIELCKKETDYEPASELLKKIQAEKLAKELEKKKPITKKKSKK